MRAERKISIVYIYLACLVLIMPFQWLIGWVLAVLIHETGHWIAVRVCGGKILSVSAVLGGLDMSTTPMTRGRMVLCLLSGPIFGIIPTIFCRFFPAFAVSSFLLSIYNLIPIRPLDGGRVLELLLWKYKHQLELVEIAFIAVGVVGCIYVSIRYHTGLILVVIMAQLIVKNRKLTCKRGYDRVQ